MGIVMGVVMIVPWQDVDVQALNNMLEEFVTRDGTDYGEREVSLAARVEQVIQQLRSGGSVIWFDAVTETITIMSRQDADAAALLSDSKSSDSKPPD